MSIVLKLTKDYKIIELYGIQLQISSDAKYVTVDQDGKINEWLIFCNNEKIDIDLEMLLIPYEYQWHFDSENEYNYVYTKTTLIPRISMSEVNANYRFLKFNVGEK